MIVRNPARGYSLLEIMVSFAVMSFIFGFSAFLLFMSGRNVLNVRDQIASQTAAANAAERIVTIMRNGTNFKVVANDNPVSGPLTRIQVIRTGTNSQDTTSIIAWHSVKKQLWYFASSTGVTWNGSNPVGTPSGVYKNLSNFKIDWESKYRARLSFFFQYRGFALYFHNPGNPQFGQFITDAIARNHYIDDGTTNDYADDGTTTAITQL